MHVSALNSKCAWIETSLFSSPQNLPLFICPPVHLDKVLLLPAEEFELELETGGATTITVPKVHTGPAPVHTRLISYELREGQVCIYMYLLPEAHLKILQDLK